MALRFQLLLRLVTAALLLAAPAQAAPVKIGLILPLTGSAASWGTHMKHAADLAMEDLAKVPGNRVAVSIEDDQLNAMQAVKAFSKLTDMERIDVAILFGGQSVAAVGPLAQKLKVPIFAITANSGLTHGNGFVFRHWVDASVQVKLLVPFLEKKSLRKVATVAVTHEAMLDYAAKFRAAAPEAEIKEVFFAEVLPAESDFRSIIQRIRAAQPDAVLVSLLPPAISSFMKQLRQSNMSLPAFGFTNTETTSEVVAAGGAMEGMIYIGPKLDTRFVQRYQEKFGEYPELSTGNVYDMIGMVAQIVKEGATGREEIRNKLAVLHSYDGVFGNYGVNGDNDFMPAAELKVISGGQFLPLAQTRSLP